MRTALPASFYDRDPARVARDLLGATLAVAHGDGWLHGRIVETEAYLGPHDPACHAVAGLTPRTRHLHGPPGTNYVYRIYGLHWCMNAVTLAEGIGSAVLLRGIEPLDGHDVLRARRPAARRDADLANGPAKLCAAYGITGMHDGTSLVDGPVRILPGDAVPDAAVRVTPRIGISRAADWPLRFLVAGSPGVSRTPTSFPVLPWSPPS